ncbi:hypothetical protein ACFD8S_004700, partial [Escherichia coli]
GAELPVTIHWQKKRSKMMILQQECLLLWNGSFINWTSYLSMAIFLPQTTRGKVTPCRLSFRNCRVF